MENTLLYIGITTSALMLIKLVMMVVGGDFGADSDLDLDLDHDVDLGGDHGHASLGDDVQIISVFTVLVFLMMGSWAGWAAIKAFHQDDLIAVGAALGIGAVSMYGTAWLMAKLRGLQSDGTLKDFDPVGIRGEVYMRIPPAGEGEGQVRLTVKGRTRDFRAVSDGDEAIDSFTPVEVLNMSSDQVMLVRKTG